MLPHSDFLNLPKSFWANVRTISQKVGYTVRPKNQPGKEPALGSIKVPTLLEIKQGLESLNLNSQHLIGIRGKPNALGKKLCAYFEYRADILNRIVEPQLMNAEQAVVLYEKLTRKLGVKALMPMNKQSVEKKKLAYFTCIINLLIQSSIELLPCNFNPQELTTITRNNQPFRTLARRIDGAFPGPINPIAVWEIKEYYYTTTFGSRVADGVYETLLDGMELEELDAALQEFSGMTKRTRHIQHLLMVDAHFTWWVKGRSYLCRIIDMLHMGYLDEVLFGAEVETRLPEIVQGWVSIYKKTSESNKKP